MTLVLLRLHSSQPIGLFSSRLLSSCNAQGNDGVGGLAVLTEGVVWRCYKGVRKATNRGEVMKAKATHHLT
ncbi:hypothetical protein E2C01_085813 [Portunus trituberculatus]|uniref:Uncharacterized protein n=1 Tax=Portunus trituberculatus TaxID=210409 RepID=A0A5B7IZ45_PORTR|nr:hypothetical protein [Portunus trituberculatus]